LEYRYRIDRALDFIDRVITEERAVADILGTARAWIERLPLAAVLGVIVVWLVERFNDHGPGVFSTNAGFVLFIVAGVFVAALLHQTRKLPDTRSGDGESGRRSGDRQPTRETAGSPSGPSSHSPMGLDARRRSLTRRQPHETSPSESTVDL
jgi:hypothetical protein